MTRKEQIKILDDKIKTNKRQYDLDRINAQISACSSGDLPKYEYLTKKDLGYKPDAVKQAKFEYSPLRKVFTDELDKSDKNKGILQRLKNIEDNRNSNDDNKGNGKVGIFQIIKDIKDKGIKISNEDKAIREIREHIQNLRNEGVRVNNFDEISREIRDHIQNLKDEGINVNINNDQVNDLVNEILLEYYFRVASRVLFTFVPNKQYGQLISISPYTLFFLKTMNTEFSEIEIWFIDQNNNALEIEDNVHIKLIINKN